MINLRGEKLRLFDALLDIGYIEDTSFVEGKEILPVERSTILGKTNGANIANLKKETKLFGEKILFRDNNTARGEATSHEGLIHRIVELVDVVERQLLIHGMSDTFEEAKTFRLMLDRNVRDMKQTLSSAGRSEEGGGGITTSARSSLSRSCRSASCARDWLSCSCCAGAAIVGAAERERMGMRSSKEGRLNVIKWSHRTLSGLDNIVRLFLKLIFYSEQ